MNEDARAFGQDPHAVVPGVLDKASDLDDEDPVGITYKGSDHVRIDMVWWVKNKPNKAVWQALFGEPVCHCSMEGGFGGDTHVEPKVPQDEQHLAVCGAFTPVEDRSAKLGLRGTTCDIEQCAFDQR